MIKEPERKKVIVTMTDRNGQTTEIDMTPFVDHAQYMADTAIELANKAIKHRLFKNNPNFIERIKNHFDRNKLARQLGYKNKKHLIKSFKEIGKKSNYVNFS